MAKMDSLVELIEKFRGEADFVIIYIDEAHASDGWAFKNNYADISNHKCLEDRIIGAKILTSLVELNCPLVVDTMTNEARYSYGALPERLVIIKDNVVEFIGGKGPFGYKLEEVDAWLEKYVKSK